MGFLEKQPAVRTEAEAIERLEESLGAELCMIRRALEKIARELAAHNEREEN